MARYVRNPTTGLWELVSGKPGVMVGATAESDGSEGECSAPAAGDKDKYWTGGAKWESDTANLITTYTTEDNANTTDIITPSGGETAISAMESGAKHSRLFNKVSRIALNTRKLINTVKRIWATVATSWASGETYAVGDIRIWSNGHTYVCKLAHTSSSSITPANTTYWEDKTLGEMITSLNSNYANLSYDSGWIRFNPASGVNNVSVYRKVGSIVYVRAVVNANDNADDTLLGILPDGFRPSFQVHVANYRPDNNENRISITNDGKVIKYGSGSSWINCIVAFPV